MKIILNFFRKIGLLRANYGDNITGEYGNKKNIKKEEDGTELKKIEKYSLGIIIFWVLVLSISVFLCIVLFKYSFSFWWLIFFVFWFLFFQKYKKIVFASGSIGIKGWVIFSVLIIFSWIFLVPTNRKYSNNKINKNIANSNKTSLLKINQANFSSFIFGSNSKGGRDSDTVNLIITPMLNLSLSDSVSTKGIKLKSLAIENLKFSKKPAIGEIKIIMPKHNKKTDCSNILFGDCRKKINPKNIKSDKNKFVYEVLNNHTIEQGYYDQINTDFISPQFKILFYNIGSVDCDKIMSKTGSFNSARLANYANIKASDLKSKLEFDIVASFDNGETSKKHLVVNFNGDDLIKQKTVQAEY